MKYIQRKNPVYKTIETVDQLKTLREARLMLREYRECDKYAYYYISQKPCKDWIH